MATIGKTIKFTARHYLKNQFSIDDYPELPWNDKKKKKTKAIDNNSIEKEKIILDRIVLFRRTKEYF